MYSFLLCAIDRVTPVSSQLAGTILYKIYARDKAARGEQMKKDIGVQRVPLLLVGDLTGGLLASLCGT